MTISAWKLKNIFCSVIPIRDFHMYLGIVLCSLNLAPAQSNLPGASTKTGQMQRLKFTAGFASRDVIARLQVHRPVAPLQLADKEGYHCCSVSLIPSRRERPGYCLTSTVRAAGCGFNRVSIQGPCRGIGRLPEAQRLVARAGRTDVQKLLGRSRLDGIADCEIVRTRFRPENRRGCRVRQSL